MAARAVVVSLIIVACALAYRCTGGTTIWSAESKSPDGLYVASARTDQWAGPGTAYVSTSVYLKQSNSSQPPVEVLALSDDSAYPAGITSVEMSWLTPSHLDIKYKGHATIDFQAAIFQRVVISVQDTSVNKTGNGSVKEP